VKYVLQGTKVPVVPLVTNASLLKLNLRDNWMEGVGGATMLKENCYITGGALPTSASHTHLCATLTPCHPGCASTPTVGPYLKLSVSSYRHTQFMIKGRGVRGERVLLFLHKGPWLALKGPPADVHSLSSQYVRLFHR
jgi:hypothetical protein